MKKIFCSLLLVLAGFFLHAQSHLRISSISGIPADSVFEANTYDSIFVTVVNDDTFPFADDLQILMKSTSSQFTDSLILSSFVSIPAGDSTTLNRTGYTFTPNFLSEGDNIIVVWPNARNVNVVTDSLKFNVFFVSLIATVPDITNETITLYPNPAFKYIAFKDADRIEVKCVRIYDIFGKEIYTSPSIRRIIPVNEWSRGLYLISIEKADGTLQTIKLQLN